MILTRIIKWASVCILGMGIGQIPTGFDPGHPHLIMAAFTGAIVGAVTGLLTPEASYVPAK